MRRLKWFVLVAVAAVLSIPALASVSSAGSEHAPAAALGPYYQTFVGKDFRPLDNDDVVRFAPNTGGGVWVRQHSAPTTPSYLELGLDLPTGAQVSEVTYYVRSCDRGVSASTLYFGSYAPATGSFAYIIAPTPAPFDENCALTQSVVVPVTPTHTVDNATARYVIGYHPNVIGPPDTYDANSIFSLLVGARVTYHLPGALLPIIHR